MTRIATFVLVVLLGASPALAQTEYDRHVAFDNDSARFIFERAHQSILLSKSSS